jgi:hypothetical protein
MTPDRRTREPGSLAGYSPPLLRPRNKMRWVGFVLLNLAAFSAINLFWFYLRRGMWMSFSGESYRQDLLTTLARILLEPVSILSEPWMLLIIALLLSVIVVVPLTMAVMYQLLLAMLFVLVVAVLGHEPMFAFALALGCLLSARSRLRREFPLLAIIVGILPVGIYLVFDFIRLDAALLQPEKRLLLGVPYLLALGLVLLTALTVVGMARWLKFQPGVVWPALLLATPAVVLFFISVGPAELNYALLIRRAPARITEAVPGFTGHTDTRSRDLERFLNRGNRYLEHFPDSPRSASVAWMLAASASLQPDLRQGPSDNDPAFTTAYPLRRSRQAWQSLLERYPDSDQAALALWRLGELNFRGITDLPEERVLGRAAEATEQLESARERLADIVDRLEQRQAQQRLEFFEPLASLPAPDAYEQAFFEVRKLLWVITWEDNRVLQDPAAARILARLLAVNPYLGGYRQRLRELLEQPDVAESNLADNIRLAIAKLEPDLWDKADALLEVAADERTDAAYEAYFQLGRIAMMPGIAPTIGLKLEEPAVYFKKLLDAKQNPWQQKAKENIDYLFSVTVPAEKEGNQP